MLRKIEVNDDVYKAIQRDAIPLEDTPETVLRRWADRLGFLGTEITQSNESTNGTRSTNESTIDSTFRKRPITRERPPHYIKSITQEEVIPYIVKYLKSVGGRADKRKVELEIYKMLENVYSQSFYQKEGRDGVKR